MMEFDPILTPFFTWVLGIGFSILLIFQVIHIQKSTSSTKRKAFRQLLNGLLLITLLFFFLNPVWRSEQVSSPVLVVSQDFNQEEISFWKDSLGVEKVLGISDFQSNFDSLILLGAEFPTNFLYSIRAKSMDWIIPNSKDRIEFIQWKGILRQGEIQKIRLKTGLKAGTVLRVLQAGNELEKLEIDEDRSDLDLEIPVSILGRNEWELALNDLSLGIIRFYVQPIQSLTYQIQVGFPGPEIRTLSRFLIGKGASVQEEIQLSKNSRLLAGKLPLDSIDVFILDPSQISDSRIQKQIAKGASLLLLNLNEPEKEAKILNKAFGTDFELVATASKSNRSLEDGLEALPFVLKDSFTQKSLFDNSVAIHQLGNSKIGLSLVADTYSLAQAGDSMAYAKIWDRILGEVQPEQSNNLSIEMPVFQNQFFNLTINAADQTNYLNQDSDSLRSSQSLINRQSKIFQAFSTEAGWQKQGQQAEVYSYSNEEWPAVYAQQERANYLKSKVWMSSNPESIGIKKPIPFWIWGLVLMGILTLIWIEPKIEA